MLELVLPMPVSTNVYYRNFNGRMLISAQGRQYAQQVRIAVLTQLGRIKPLEERLSVEVDFFAPDKRKRDLDNFCGKSLLDAMAKAGVYLDDEQIDKLIITRRAIVKPGKVLVRITEIKGLIANIKEFVCNAANGCGLVVKAA